MAQKRIRMVRNDILNSKVRLLYDDGSQGELDMADFRIPIGKNVTLVGLTLKQAKMALGIKK